MNGKIEPYESPTRNAIEESINDAPETEQPVSSVPLAERPTTLTLCKQEIGKVDTMSLLSPVSPISKQVNGRPDIFFSALISAIRYRGLEDESICIILKLYSELIFSIIFFFLINNVVY